VGPAANMGVETAFAPNNGFDKGGFDPITVRCGANGHVLAVFEPELPRPVGGGSRGEEEQDYKQEQPTPFHGVLLAHAECGVETNNDFLFRGHRLTIQLRRGEMIVRRELKHG
jgi:hypothetical protein